MSDFDSIDISSFRDQFKIITIQKIINDLISIQNSPNIYSNDLLGKLKELNQMISDVNSLTNNTEQKNSLVNVNFNIEEKNIFNKKAQISGYLSDDDL